MYMFAIPNDYKRRAFAAVLLLLLATTTATAADDKALPITITSDTAELSRVTNVSTYTGHVVLVRGGLTLNGDKLVITRVQPSQYEAVLTGNPATLDRQPQAADEELITGHSDKIIYLTSTSQVTLRGDAVVNRGGDVIHSAVIVHDLDTQKTTAGGGAGDDSRVKITLHPDQEGSDK